MFRVDLGEAADSGPYPTFDAFFTRRLKPGARPIATSHLVSPADGKLSAAGAVNGASEIVVKSQTYGVAELLGSSVEARDYDGGEFVVVYLSPRDYHRVHSPVDGEISLVRGISGDLYPVNSIGEQHIDGLFVRNNRVLVRIETVRGPVSVILVGATIVGRISVTVIPEPAVPHGDTLLSPRVPVQRGDELGMFHLGSTAVVLLPRGLSTHQRVGSIKMGEALSEGGDS